MSKTREKKGAKVGILCLSFVFALFFFFSSPKDKRGAQTAGRGPAEVLADTVGSTAKVRVAISSSAPSGFPFQRKTWYDGSRYWKSFHNGDDNRMEFWYKDGDLWLENTTARVGVDTNDFTVEVDSDNLFLAYTSGYDIATRAASSYPGTAFSWGTTTAAFDGTLNDNFEYPALAKDTGGKVWLAGKHQVGLPAGSGSTGPNDPTSAGEDTGTGSVSWSGYTNVYENDDTDYATVTLGKKVESRYIEATGFGFSFSNCNTIVGIQVEVDRKSNDAADMVDGSVMLVNGSGTITGNDKADGVTDWPTTDAYASYGGSTDGWGANLSCSDVTSSNFGVVFSAYNAVQTAPRDITAYVDHIRITVWYGWEADVGYIVEAVQSTNATDITSWSTSSTIDGSTSNTEKYATLAPLASGDMYAAIATDSSLVGCKYDAQTDNRWEDTGGSTCENGANQDVIDTKKTGMEYGMSMVHDETNNYAHLTYINDAGSLMYRKYTSSWSSASTVDSSQYCGYPSLSILSEKNDELYAFWIQEGDLFAVESTSPYTDWSGTVNTIDDTGSNYWDTSGYEGFGSCSMFAEWNLGSGSSTLVEWTSLTPDACVELGDPPTIETVNLNNGADIYLEANTTKEVDLTASVTDSDGCSDLGTFSGVIYLNDLDLTCSADDNSCYRGGDVTCSTTACNTGTAEVTCTSNLWFHANPEQWKGTIQVTDGSNNTTEGTSSAVTVHELLAMLSAESDIHYGAVPEGNTTGSNQTVSLTTVGNVALDCSLSGTDMTSSDSGGSISVTNQKYALGSSTYGNLDNTLLSTDGALEFSSVKPITNPSGQTEIIYWGLRVPSGTPGATDYQGTNTITATED